ncbi:hypothetical protein OG800_49575 (plasmid) [Streptomyces sp. NBC_00445]|uniref:hypothetical protein n=1 Tax=Streptomyces sp. NBC_00445 TaxID=2975745 RepID=UPI002E21DC71
MSPSPVAPRLAEEQLTAALHHGIQTIQRNRGSCTVDDVTAFLVEQLTAGLLREAAAPEQASALSGQLDVDALVQAHYDIETTVSTSDARVRFTPGLAASSLTHGEHLDIRAEASLKYRVDLRFECGLASTDGGATWSLAFTKADKEWLDSSKAMKVPVGERVTALVHDPEHRTGLEPIVEAARNVAAMRALSLLKAAREQLARAGCQALAARAVFDRYDCAAGDLDRLRNRLGQLASERNRGLIGW